MDIDTEKSDKLVELALVLGQQNDYQEILRLVAEKARELLDAPVVLISMINPRTRQTLKTMFREGDSFEDKQFRALQTHVSGWIITNQQAFVSVDIRKDTRFVKDLFKKFPLKYVLGVPLRIEGLLIGSFLLAKKDSKANSREKEIAFLQKFVAIATPFLRNVHKIQQYFELNLAEDAILLKYEKLGLLGKSQKFIGLLRSVEAAARSDVRVMLQGETGTGKELVAKAIHRFSGRSDMPFLALDCGAIPAHLLESELFGYKKGAFTGATADRKGLLEEADGGTFFMDEISNLPLEMQTKLMRFLQEGEIRPLGSNRTRNIDVRIISASSDSLEQLVTAKKFRQDLYYRLYVYPIPVPSLNARVDDIPLLANHFLRGFAAEQKKQAARFHEEVVDFMKVRKWTGNIRELENFVERLTTLAPATAKILDADLLPDELKKEMKKLSVNDGDYVVQSLTELLTEYEERVIRTALVQNKWNQSRAARALKIPVQTITLQRPLV